jgi:o-succinylbenzoate---CoA ligase
VVVTELSIAAAAAEDGQRVGLIAGGREYRYAELADLVYRAESALTGHDLVALVAHRDVSTVVALYAALQAGRHVVLVHPRLTEHERARLPMPKSGRGTGPRLTLFTSGSTGEPRPVTVTAGHLLASARASAANLGWRDDDRWLCPLPLAHVGGLSVLTRALIARRCAVLGEVEDIAAWQVTLASVVPTQLLRLLERPAPRRLRAVLVGGAAAAATLLQRARDCGYPVLATYGMTEACSQIATEPEPGAGLRPLPGVKLRIVDDRIYVRGPSVVGTDWLDTGDLGCIDELGRLQVWGRADDVIITGGENVHPAEVESALLAVPAVAEACVFAVPDAKWGQVVAAALVAPSPPDDGALVELVRGKLAPFKRPRRVCYVQGLPRTAAGKLDRRATARLAGPRLRPLVV